MGSISSLSSSSLQAILSVLQKSTTNSSSAASSASQLDSSQISPLAKLLSELQTLQQSDPSQYQQVTQQIATNLQSAAKTDTADGNTSGANQLEQLATDFTNASSSDQLPNIQDLAQAIGGGHHHHHHAEAESSNSESASDTTSQLQSAYQSGNGQSSSTDPLAIILNTLNSAGITTGN